VEGARLHSVRAERREPRAHLRRRAGGERHGQHLPPGYLSGQRAVRDAVGDGPRLAGARASEDAHRPGRGGHGGALLRVEPGQHPVRWRVSPHG
jgi:hypothetical protein